MDSKTLMVEALTEELEDFNDWLEVHMQVVTENSEEGVDLDAELNMYRDIVEYNQWILKGNFCVKSFAGHVLGYSKVYELYIVYCGMKEREERLNNRS